MYTQQPGEILEVMGLLNENCKSLQVLCLGAEGYSCPVNISTLLQNNPDLRKVHLVRISLTFDMIFELAKCCPKLTHLIREHQFESMNNLAEWVQVIKSFKHLQYLHNNSSYSIEYKNHNGMKFVRLLSYYSDEYTTLFTEIQGFTCIRMNITVYVPETVYDLITQNSGDTITELCLTLLTNNSQEQIDNCVSKLPRLLSQCKNLSTLTLSPFSNVSYEDWVMLAQSTSNLRTLKFYYSTTLDIEDIICWMDTNKHLKIVEINGCKHFGKRCTGRLNKLEAAAIERNMEIQFDHKHSP